VAKKTILHKEVSANDMIVQLMEFSNKARKEGILSLQGMMEQISDDFLLKAVQMAVDGQEPDTLRHMLNTEISYIQERHGSGAAIFTALATYAPAMGMVGTLIGLVQMLQNMSDPIPLGPPWRLPCSLLFTGQSLPMLFAPP